MAEPATERGKRTRERILRSAAQLIHEQGVHATSVEQVLAVSGTGKSQFYHYFPSKDHLVQKVLAFHLDEIVREQGRLLDGLDTWAGIQAWFDFIINWHGRRRLLGGCPVGSLAAELAQHDEGLRQELVRVFGYWESSLQRGLEAMRKRGELRPEADPVALGEAVLAAIQGGILLAVTKKDLGPLKNALAGAWRCLRSYASEPGESNPEHAPVRVKEGRLR